MHGLLEDNELKSPENKNPPDFGILSAQFLGFLFSVIYGIFQVSYPINREPNDGLEP